MLTHTFPIIHSLLTGAVMLDGMLYTTSTLSLSLMQADSFLSNSISMELFRAVFNLYIKDFRADKYVLLCIAGSGVVKKTFLRQTIL